MAFDFGSDDNSWDSSPTQTTDYSTATSRSGHVSYGLPESYIDTERSDGVTFGGIFSNVAASAGTLFDTFGKIYNLNSQVENAKFQRTVNEANLELKKAGTLGAIDIKRAQIDANIAIEKARASRAVGDATSRIESQGAVYVQSPSIKPIYLIGGVLAFGAFLYMRGKAK